MSTILVVDDDRDTRNMLRLALEMAGHMVVEAHHGKAALDLIKPTFVPDIVLTDLVMPVLNGTELIEQLRAELRTAAVPIIVVSGSFDAARTVEASGHVQAVVLKPFDVRVLLDVIQNLAGEPEAPGPDLGRVAV